MSSLMYRSVAEIDPGLCIKCGKCSLACPEGIIAWTPKSVPKINQRLCTACGLCVAACPVGGMRIVRKPSVLPLAVLTVFLIVLIASTYLTIIAGHGPPEASARPLENPVGWTGGYTIETPYTPYTNESTPKYSVEYEPSEKSGG
ncbi:MAG: 4Fe-4S binding protein [Thermoprotei archaeon]|nr:4Fe-4S binding protein [Thermoprotei archaeon]